MKTLSYTSRLIVLRLTFPLLLLSHALTMTAQNVTGYVKCGTAGVPGVAVSDGDTVVVTDDTGYYAFTSAKRNGYVFCSAPRGYEYQMAYSFRPRFWQALRYPNDPAAAESHDFTLKAASNDDYTLIVAADSHLANRNEDLTQFKDGFVARVKEEKREAPGRIYSIILGDLTWDNYWYARNYSLQDFVATCKSYSYNVPLFPVIGNHDYDGAVPAGDDCDFLAAAPWRKYICPTYYSFNLGRVHYVVLDDVYYINEDKGGDYAKGIVGSRNYTGRITDDQMRWLQQDLALQDPNEPLVIALHIPVWRVRLGSPFDTTEGLADNQSVTLSEMVREFKQVHIISGHLHTNMNPHPTSYRNIMEHNVAAICATFWWSGKFTGHHICQDGSPGGYSLWTVNGDDIKWKFHSIEKNGNLQMRLYDMNTVKEFFATDETALKMLDTYPSRTNYSNFAKNRVMVNVFAYDKDWKIEAYEGYENPKRRSATRIAEEDPFHTIAYDIPGVATWGHYTFGTGKTAHLFSIPTSSDTTSVTVRVTDSFGNLYVQTIKRPHPFNLDMESLQTDFDPIAYATGIKAPTDFPLNNEDIYDLSGRKIPHGTQPRGIHIVGGRKILRR